MENKQNSTIRGCTKFTEVLLVTANVGSLFEDPKRLLKPWLGEFLLKVSQINPEFIALHLQEVGGKTYEKSMEYVQEFIKHLCEASDLCEYSCIRIYMDEDYKSAEHFTALGNIYFTHKSLNHVKIWNFCLHTWESALDKNIYSGNIEAIVTKEKSKFPQHFFPECKWSRKGFMRTRWDINGTVIDLVNIHLFHDASNLVACEEFPSVYCKTRRRALVHTLEKFHTDTQNGLVPFFIFGDFNFRCDTEGVIKKLTESLSIHRVYNIKHDSTKMHYRNADGDNVLTVGKKEFIHADHQLKFKESWLHEFDRELEALREVLVEYPIKFPPTYPYEEDPEMPTDYMSTRCPAWCDRILMSLQAREIIENGAETDDSNNENPYNTIGEHVCMGDHKPIYLHFKLKTNQGIYSCCQCHLHFANTNKSTSLNRSASIQNNCDNSTVFYCHYNSQVYTEVLIECSKLNCNNIFDQNNKSFPVKICTNLPHEDHSSLIGSSVLNELKLPQVSINVFDSDNINVCMCSRKANYTTEHINGLFCPECGNLITRQNLSHRCTLTSKRLMLSNDIIVNRIDTQYLNTYSDFTHQRQEPYTPESAESHSPYPELNSSTTTSCNSHSTFKRHLEKNHHSDQCKSLQTQYKVYSNENAMPRNDDLKGETIDTVEIHRRGIVTPGQLKSRLEDLQRSSHNLYDIHGEDAGKSDVENVGKICQPNIVFEKPKCSCLPGCCKIS